MGDWFDWVIDACHIGKAFYTNISFSPALFFSCFNYIYLYVIYLIGHLQDGVILLLQPEFFLFFLSHLNLVIPAKFKQQKL